MAALLKPDHAVMVVIESFKRALSYCDPSVIRAPEASGRKLKERDGLIAVLVRSIEDFINVDLGLPGLPPGAGGTDSGSKVLAGNVARAIAVNTEEHATNSVHLA